jgi:hypothetical protein
MTFDVIFSTVAFASPETGLKFTLAIVTRSWVVEDWDIGGPSEAKVGASAYQTRAGSSQPLRQSPLGPALV